MAISAEQTGEDSIKEPEKAPDNTPIKEANPGLKGLSVRQKVYIGFGGLILLTAVNMGYTLFKLNDVEQIGKSAIEQRQPAANLFQKLTKDLNYATTLLNGYLLTGQKDQREEFDIVTQDITGHMAYARQLDVVKAGEVKSETLDRAEDLYKQFLVHVDHLYHLHDSGLNNRGIILAQETINPQANQFLNNINILISSEDLDLSDPDETQAYLMLEELRYLWVQTMSSMRLFITTQREGLLENFRSYNIQAGVLLDKLSQMDIEIGLGELEEMIESRNTYNANILPVVEIYMEDNWRADSHMMKTKIGPILEELRQIFESTADELLNKALDNGHDLTEAQEQISSSTIINLAIVLLIGTLLALKITEGIVPPIHHLMSAAKQISDGDLSAEVMITTKDEIGMLGHSFNTMVNDLRAAALKESNLIEELTNLNEELENRVEERTEELGRSESKIRAILDNIGEGILVIDESGRIESINPSAQKIFLFNEKEAIGVNSALLIKFDEADVSDSHSDDAYQFLFTGSNNQQPREHIGHRADGTTFPMEYVVTSMKLGNEVRHVCIIRDITQRKETEATLAEAQSQLVDAAHKSGMADMATGVLHNIGNILNSVNLSGEEILRATSGSKVKGLIKANELLAAHSDNMGEFLVNDSRGQKLPDYFIKVGKMLDDEISAISTEARALLEKTTMMKEVISTQQTYARSGFHSEELILSELLEDALKIQDASLAKWGIKLHKHCAAIPPCSGQKSKLLQVITNLIKNAKEAMVDNDNYNKPKELTLETGLLNDNVAYLKIRDNGCGINEKQLSKIFNHGFTTKQEGHGFGLHTSANAMTEMKGALRVDSEGIQRGACFTLTIPIHKAKAA